MNPAAIFVFSFGCGRGSFEGLAVTGRSVANAVFSVLPGEGFPDLAGIFGVFSGRSRRKSGNRHFPSEFCGQTTLGLTSDTSLITSRREKREKNAIRRPKFFASRKLPPVPEIGRDTSELQSLAYLVCRLLLEKKNKTPDEPQL